MNLQTIKQLRERKYSAAPLKIEGGIVIPAEVEGSVSTQLMESVDLDSSTPKVAQNDNCDTRLTIIDKDQEYREKIVSQIERGRKYEEISPVCNL